MPSTPALIWVSVLVVIVVWFYWSWRYDKKHPEQAKARRSVQDAKRADKRSQHAERQKAALQRRVERVREQVLGDDFQRQRAQEEARRLAVIKCPTCQQSGARRIGIGERAGSAVAGGLLLSRKARAQFQCNFCGYLW